MIKEVLYMLGDLDASDFEFILHQLGYDLDFDADEYMYAVVYKDEKEIARVNMDIEKVFSFNASEFEECLDANLLDVVARFAYTPISVRVESMFEEIDE